MKIDQVYIKGFGCLTDFKTAFAPHINIIYGENERGKSTLHQFIEQMFYHPYKTGYKKRQLSENFKKYKPWGKANFSGALTITDDDVRRIEKDFSTKHPKVTIYDEVGNDISTEYQLDDVYREPQFGQYHLGLSKVMFKNTVSVGQIGKYTDSEAAAEVKRYVGNIERAKDATISVQAVQEKIKAEREHIGRKTKKQSRYGKREQRLKELAEMHKQAALVEQEIAQLQVTGQQLADQIEQAEQHLAELDSYLNDIASLENNQLKQRADAIVMQIEKNEADIKVLQQYAAFNYDCVSQLKRLKADLDNAQLARQSVRREFERIAKSHDQITDTAASTDNLDKLKQSSLCLRQDCQVLTDLEADRLARQADIKFYSQQAAQTTATGVNKSFLIVAILAMLLIAGGLTQINLYVAIGALFLMAALIGYYYQTKQKAAQSVQLEKAKQRQQIEQLQLSLNEIDSKITAVLEKYQVADSNQLYSKAEAIKEDLLYARLEQRKQAEQLDKKVQLATQLTAAERQLREIDDNLVKLDRIKVAKFSKLAIDSFEKLDDYHQQFCQLEVLKQKNVHQQHILNEVLAGRDYHCLQFEKVIQGVAISDKEFYSKERENIQYSLIETRKMLQQNSQQIASLERQNRTIQAIEEEIDELLKQREVDDKRLKVLDIIDSKIALSIDKLQKTVMPEVNKAIRQIVSTVTDGKYDDIKINGELAVFVVDKTNATTVPLEQLSAGTIDLMYIGLRIGMANLLNDNKNVPLFFDDAFSQIDSKRLTKLLAYLATLDRQILIFTCHQRESQLLEALNISYQRIDL